MVRNLESLIQQETDFLLKKEAIASAFYESIRPLDDDEKYEFDPHELRAKAIYWVLIGLFDESPRDDELIQEAQQLLSEQIKQR